jgi:hypothetical protein
MVQAIIMSAGAVPSWGTMFQSKYARFSGVINWFPGHMAKTAKQVRDTIRKVDLVVEVRDARVSLHSPIYASRHLLLLIYSVFDWQIYLSHQLTLL